MRQKKIFKEVEKIKSVELGKKDLEKKKEAAKSV